MLLSKIIFRKLKEIAYAETENVSVNQNDRVIVQTENSLEFAKILNSEKNLEIDTKNKDIKIHKILRLCNNEDLLVFKENEKFCKEVVNKYIEVIQKYNLDMNLTAIEYTYNREKVFVYYYAENRVDFRELIKELNATFKTKVQMVQIGIRDESKIIGGIGHCGRVFCCKDFMKNFSPVVIDMAKDQEIPLNPTKISGVCGRLLCCLGFEHETYLQLAEEFPEIGQEVENQTDGKGVVINKETLKRQVNVELEDGTLKKYCIDDLKFLKSKNNNSKKQLNKKSHRCDKNNCEQCNNEGKENVEGI